MASTVFYQGPEGTLSYDMYDNVAFVHCDMNDWKFSSFKKAYLVFGAFLNYASEQKFTRVATITPNPKFAKLFGGISINKFERLGKEIEVVVWELTLSPSPQ